MIEEGALYTSSDFKALDEFNAYSQLYQEAAGRATSDGAIPVLQGRAVGGSTVVNWTTSIRTPHETLAIWAQQFGVKNAGVRSEERRVGKEGVSTCRSRGSPYHKKKKPNTSNKQRLQLIGRTR